MNLIYVLSKKYCKIQKKLILITQKNQFYSTILNKIKKMIPLNLLVKIGIGAVGILLGGTIYNWKKIKISLKGKKIVIFGSIEVGKTTLHKYLREGVITKDHIATKSKEDVNENIFKLDDLELHIKEGIDVSGMDDNLKSWKEIFSKSDICFYLFDTYKVYFNNENENNFIYKHLSHIEKWKKEYNKNIPIILIGTFADKILEYRNSNKSNLQIFESKIKNKIKKGIYQIEAKPNDIFIGSLANQEEIEKLVRQILLRLSKK